MSKKKKKIWIDKRMWQSICRRKTDLNSQFSMTPPKILSSCGSWKLIQAKEPTPAYSYNIDHSTVSRGSYASHSFCTTLMQHSRHGAQLKGNFIIGLRKLFCNIRGGHVTNHTDHKSLIEIYTNSAKKTKKTKAPKYYSSRQVAILDKGNIGIQAWSQIQERVMIFVTVSWERELITITPMISRSTTQNP